MHKKNACSTPAPSDFNDIHSFISTTLAPNVCDYPKDYRLCLVSTLDQIWVI